MQNSISSRKELFRWSGWFSIFSFIIVSVLLSRFLKFTNEIEFFSTVLYMAGVITGHSISFVFLTFLLILLPAVLIIKNSKVVKTLGVISLAVGAFLLILDFEIYNQYRFHINSMVIDLLIKGRGEIFEFSTSTYIFSAFIIFLIIAVSIFISTIASKISDCSFRLKYKWVLTAFSILIILGINIVHIIADAEYYRPVTTITKHIPLYRPLTGKRFLAKHGIVDLNENWKIQKKSRTIMKNNEIRYPLKPLNFKEGRKLNILYIVIDSWRFDTLNKTVSPNMTKFIEDNHTLNFNNHTSSGNGTRVGIFGLFYGMFGSYWNSMETNQIGPLFIKTMLNKNYDMGIFASAKLTVPAFNQTVFSDINNLRLSSKGKSGWDRDINIVDEWLEWESKRDKEKPWFSFLFFDSPHVFGFPKDYKKPFKNVAESIDYHKFNNEYDRTPVMNRYKTSVHFTDSLVKRVLDRVEQSGGLKDTIVVITADHGQEINDNKKNFWGHGSNYTKYQIKVPFVVYWPGKKEKDFNHLTNHIDLTPTLMKEVFGCTNPIEDFSNGRSLFNTKERAWVFSGGGLSTDAIIEKDRITELLNTGVFEIYATDYSVLKNAKLNTSILKEVFMEKSRFYK